ncbi:MAG: hypothetical protein WC985_03520 [Thermoplasmata archaeon]
MEPVSRFVLVAAVLAVVTLGHKLRFVERRTAIPTGAARGIDAYDSRRRSLPSVK